MPDDELGKFLEEGRMTVNGYELTSEELKVGYSVGDKSQHEKYEADSDGEVIMSFYMKSIRVNPHEIGLFLDNHSISHTEVS